MTLNQVGFEKEDVNSKSYKELGQHLVTDQGMRSRPVEVLEGSFNAILLLAGANNPALLRQSQGTLGQGDSRDQCSQSGDGIKGMGDDKGDEARAVLIPGPRPPLSTDFGAIHDSTPAYKPDFTFSLG